MTNLVSAEEIEAIVGINRHIYKHYARAVSNEQVVYILHSKACLLDYPDLRRCPLSIALDSGIDEYDWSDREDMCVEVVVSRRGKLVPFGRDET